MDKRYLDLYINNSGFYDPIADVPIETYTQFLDYLNVTEFNAEAHFHVEWDRHGVLKNFHIQFVIEGKYEDEKFSIKPQFDISLGEHDAINAKFTVPGYSVYLVIFAGVVTVSVVIIRIKRKKS